MRDLLDHHSIANNVRMLRAADKTSVIVIAEDAASSRVLKSAFLDEYAVKVIVGHRKTNVYQAVAQLGDEITIGVVDADYERVEGKRAPASCFWFDHRDLEIMMICSKAFDRLVEEITDGAEDAPSLRQRALEACSVIGRCRINSHLSGSDVSFSGLRPDTLYNATSAQIPEDALMQWLEKRNSQLPVRHVLLAGGSFDSREVNRGHDVSAILAADLRANFSIGIGAAELEQLLRLSIRRDDFTGSRLVRELLEWEMAHGCVIMAA